MGCCTASGSTWSFFSSRSRWVRGSVVSGTAPSLFTITDMALQEVVPPAAAVTALIAGLARHYRTNRPNGR